MRKIGTIQDQGQSRVFSDYLVGLGIENDVEPSSEGGWAIWVHMDEQLEEAEAQLETFLANPQDSRYHAGANQGRARRKQQEAEDRRARAKIVDARTTFWRAPGSVIGPVTLFLLGGSTAVGLLQIANGNAGPVSLFYISLLGGGEGFLPEVQRGQVWRLITPIFLHFGIMHFLFNMLWTKDLASQIEGEEGSFKLGALVLVTAILSNVGQYYMSGPGFGGMSGVVYALFGYIWISMKHSVTRKYSLDQVNTVLIIVWFFICLAGVIPRVANTAHVVGFIIGIVWATVSTRTIPYTKIRF